MCGISGLYLKSGERPEEEQLAKMAGLMRHRGPDAEGVHVSGSVGLAHRRLSIIDLSSAANQPMVSGRYALTFNGEIYNFRELRSELEKLGHSFRTNSDTEVILKAFEAWGEASFRKFNGMFAFGLHDTESGVLYLVRDRFGIKPLFVARSSGRVAFASELKPLLGLDWVSREVDRQTLFHFLNFSHVPTPLSMVKGVSQLKPGSFLKVSARGVEEKEFHSLLEMHRQPLSAKSENELLEELEKILRDSVKWQLIADVPVGCFLSGGIDSSLLVASYAELGRPSAIETFCIGYRETEFDEAPHAREMAQAFGASHSEWIAKPQDFFDLIPQIPTYFDQPLADPTLLSSLLLSRFARTKVTVALSGDGGDELYFGYPHQQALLLLPKLGLIPQFARKAGFEAMAGLASLGGRPGQQVSKLLEIMQFGSEAELYQSFVGTIGPMRQDRLAGLINGKVDLENAWFDPLLAEAHGLKPWQKVSHAFLRTFMLDTVLAKTDRAGMAFGLEARVPFLDNEMADFAARVPFEMKLWGTTSKYLLRKLLARKLERAGVRADQSRRKKQGFSIPLREWLRGDLKYLMDDYLDRSRLEREGYFNAAQVDSLVQAHVSKRANHSHLLWSLISFQMWKERYL